MSHYAIIELNDNKEDFDHPTSDDIFDLCEHTLTDYVDYESDKDRTVEHVFARNGMAVGECNEAVVITSKKDYFEAKFNAFKNWVADWSEFCGIEDFINMEFDIHKWTFDEICNDKYNHRIYYKGSVYSMDEFVRQCDENKVYFIGEVYNYHC